LQARVCKKLTGNVVSKHLTHFGQTTMGHSRALQPGISSIFGVVSGCTSGELFLSENSWPRPLRTVVRFFLDKMTAPLNSEKRPDSERVFALRRYLIGFLFLLIFVLLDRTTVYLQVLPGISAWYPPVGIALALLIGMGPRMRRFTG